jgi:hypothetical protein
MGSRQIEGLAVQRGSGSVLADLGLVDAEKLKIKTGLVIEIRKSMRGNFLNLSEHFAGRSPPARRARVKRQRINPPPRAWPTPSLGF